MAASVPTRIPRWTPPKGPVLVLAPHPDDEAIGCGGALLQHKRRRDPIFVVFATDGEAGRPTGCSDSRDLGALRRKEARQAARILGVSELEFWHYPDGRLRQAGLLADRLKSILHRLRPRILYRPGADDAHGDHRALALATQKAIRGLRYRFTDCRYEVWSASRPTAVLDVSREFSQKLKALRAYRSQKSNVDPIALARRLNASRGLMLRNSRWGEGFRIDEKNV